MLYKYITIFPFISPDYILELYNKIKTKYNSNDDNKSNNEYNNEYYFLFKEFLDYY